jgi:hypothetical protein
MQRRSPGVPPCVYFIVQAVALCRDALTTAIDFLINQRDATLMHHHGKKARVVAMLFAAQGSAEPNPERES